MTSPIIGPLEFKVYLKNNDGSTKEMRRFNTILGFIVDFKYVREKLQHIFPELHDKDFTISWIDEDMDEIIMTNDEELLVAVRNMNNYLKLHVNVCRQNQEREENPTSKKEGGVLHHGVWCDGCDSKITGFRYKCIQCEDYDLCSQCEGLGLHADHCMIRMPQPVQWSSHHGRRLLHHTRKFLKRNGIHLGKEDIPDKFDRTCPMSGRCHRPSMPNYNIFSWLEAFAPYFNTVNENMTEAQSDNVGSSKETPKKEDKKNSKTHLGVYKISKEDIARLLDPLGLDVDIEIGPNASNTSETDKTEKKEEYKGNVTTNQNNIPKSPEKLRKLSGDKDDNKFTSDIASVSSLDTTIKKHKGTEEWTILDKNDASDISSVSSVSSNLNDIPEKQISPPTPSAPKDDSSDRTIYPQLPNEEEVNHPNPKIRDAIKTMIGMGFSNKSGLLTYLLEAEDGNINKVLDLLTEK